MVNIRTKTNQIKVKKKNDIRKIVIRQLLSDSKSLYNCSIYCHRQWYHLRQEYIKKVNANIEIYFKELTKTKRKNYKF